MYLKRNNTKAKVLLKCVCLFVAATFAGCNDDVFTENFLPEAPLVNLSAEADSVVVRFNASNWDVLGLECSYGDVGTSATSLSGEPLELPLSGGGNALVSCGNDYQCLRIEKRNGRELLFALDENLYDAPRQVYVYVGNDCETKVIEVQLAPTPKYVVDSVAYDWAAYYSWKEDLRVEPAYSITVDNRNNMQPASVTMHPYRYSKCTTVFNSPGKIWSEQNYRLVFGDPLPKMEIPDVVDGNAVMRGREVEFGLEQQITDYGRDEDFSVAVKVDAGVRQTIYMYNGIRSYVLPYTVYASCPWSGRRKTFAGTVMHRSPEGYFVGRDEPETDSDE